MNRKTGIKRISGAVFAGFGDLVKYCCSVLMKRFCLKQKEKVVLLF
jgi:hypothetical protein